MSERDDGEPAFPSHGSMYEVRYEGMSLRDYFAGQALIAVLGANWMSALIKAYGESNDDLIAKNAYALADAMLRMRKA